MGPHKELIVNEGKKSFYDDVLRYKNPHSDSEAISWWFLGWDAASEEHKLFTEHKRFQEENIQLKKDVGKWRDKYNAVSVGNTFSEEKLKQAQKTAYQLELVIDEMIDIQDKMSRYFDHTGWFSFSREVIKEYVEHLKTFGKKYKKLSRQKGKNSAE